jgi:hypothetical protein
MLTILWGTKHPFENEWERDWLSEIFRSLDIEYTITNLTETNQLVQNALIVLNHDINYIPYLRLYEENSIPFSVIHLSDEWVNDNVEFYKYPMCKFIYRNYFHPKYINNKVSFFALGYKKEFLKDLPYNFSQILFSSDIKRDYIWSFAGTPKHTRSDKLALFKSLQPYKIVWEEGDSFGIQTTGLKTPDYRALMLNSKFVICLEGNYSVDSFRVYEALECGCIPVVVSKFYWKSLFNKMPPFIVSDYWQENFSKINTLTDQNIETIRLECVNFWNDYKSEFKNTLKNNIITYLK